MSDGSGHDASCRVFVRARDARGRRLRRAEPEIRRCRRRRSSSRSSIRARRCRSGRTICVLLAAVLGLLGIGTIEIYSATAADGAHALSATPRTSSSASSAIVARRRRSRCGSAPASTTAGSANWTYPLLLGSLRAARRRARDARRRNGAKRWIPLGPLTFQPVEIAKLALVTYLACSLGRKADQVKTFTIGFVPHLVVCGMMMVLLLKQPDLGSSVVLGATTLGMLFMAGARVSYIVLAVLGVGAGRVSPRRRHAVAHAALPRVLQPRGVRERERATSSCRRGSRSARAG